MPVRTSYFPGTPCWADVSTPGIDQGIAFYTGLLGWSAHTVPDPEAGGYTIFKHGEHPVAGAMPAQDGGPPPMWNTYFACEDVEATAAKIRAAGGAILMEPLDVMDAGRMAMGRDPTGAIFSIWEAGQTHGAGLVGEAGSMAWNELTTGDVPEANAFYADVFGWQAEAMPMPDSPTDYQIQKVDGDLVAGIMETPEAAGNAPPYWMVYFAVGDADAAIAEAQGRGGSLLHGPIDTPYGPMAVLADPAGAVFSVIKLTQQQ